MRLLMCVVMALSVSPVEREIIDEVSRCEYVTRCECLYYLDTAYVAIVVEPIPASKREALLEEVERSIDDMGLSHLVVIDDGAYYLIKRTKETQDYDKCIDRLDLIYARRRYG